MFHGKPTGVRGRRSAGHGPARPSGHGLPNVRRISDPLDRPTRPEFGRSEARAPLSEGPGRRCSHAHRGRRPLTVYPSAHFVPDDGTRPTRCTFHGKPTTDRATTTVTHAVTHASPASETTVPQPWKAAPIMRSRPAPCAWPWKRVQMPTDDPCRSATGAGGRIGPAKSTRLRWWWRGRPERRCKGSRGGRRPRPPDAPPRDGPDPPRRQGRPQRSARSRPGGRTRSGPDGPGGGRRCGAPRPTTVALTVVPLSPPIPWAA
jgi:hypothetical protein